MRPDIGGILQYARQQGLIIHLMTNATRITPSFADLLHEVGVDQVNASIYEAIETVYERIGHFRNCSAWICDRSSLGIDARWHSHLSWE